MFTKIIPAAVVALMAGPALAQTAVVVTPDAPVAIVTEDARATGTPAGFVDYVPMLEQFDNNVVIAETLVAQGFTNIAIHREGTIMTVTATRDGQPVELVYSTANGRLISVNGERLPEDHGDHSNDPADSRSEADENDAS
ncbi:hypothetical protein [Paracoccus sp. (in: a-proteobacteria)]|uniref:hypothetical protein n=1 Tax=Paracoccus sp. TaxID=267 RepID=UPI0026DF9F0C|nr:hypothetical protein [Paracoccus sp. (in: a-proteobacteria)]MDO5647065.1 hypothetical protein [Paracoccus sp. (in: a-proteobacteria)]